MQIKYYLLEKQSYIFLYEKNKQDFIILNKLRKKSIQEKPSNHNKDKLYPYSGFIKK